MVPVNKTVLLKRFDGGSVSCMSKRNERKHGECEVGNDEGARYGVSQLVIGNRGREK